jgi:dipeptidyl aminopeptidase/acylaminoacyl peptidase
MRGAAFSPLQGDMRMLGSSTASGFERPFIWNPITHERMNLELANNDGDWAPVDWSPDASAVLLCQTHQAIQQLWLYEIASKHITKLDHPSGFYETSKGRGTYFYSPTQIFAGWEDAGHPPQVIELNAKTGKMQRDVLVASRSLPGQSLRSIQFASSDGQLIQGWLGVPEGAGPFPTVIYLHGGSEFAVMNWYDSESQAWIDHGFAFLTINYRGSTMFGREFQEKIWGNQGYWEVEDIVAARNWLVQAGISDTNRIFLSGWSYGGYLTLLALGKKPEWWAGGMAGTAITDWSINYHDSADTLRSYIALAFNGTPTDKPDQFAKSSPITYAENVQAPVLIIQGINDTRTPPRQIEQYESKLKNLGKQIDVHWYDAGHSVGDVALLIQHTEMMITFASHIARQKS